MATLAAAAKENKADGDESDEEDWDLAGRMTPDRMTPTENASTSPAPVDEVVERAKQALALANARRRRSSAAKKNIPAIAQAMDEAKERRRRSLAKKLNTSGDSQDQ